MRIGVDATCWVNGRGYGRFTRELLTALCRRAEDHEFLFFIEEENADRIELAAENVQVIAVPLSQAPTTAAAAASSRSIRDMLRMKKAVRTAAPDVFFFPTVYSFFPMPRGQKTVVTIHDAIAERFPRIVLGSRKAEWFWKLKVWLADRQSDLILTVSNFAAGELERIIGIDRKRIRVATEAPAPSYRPGEPAEIRETAQRYGIDPDRPWFTYVGGFNPHKRIPDLIQALADLDSTDSPQLVLVGSISDVFHDEIEQIRRTIVEAGIEDQVKWPGFVDDEALRHLHSGARALVLPSECEGFGLPAVEAAACACPVIATKQSPLPEILDGGGIFVSPGDRPALLRALQTYLDSPETRDRDGRQARDQTRSLSWRFAADSTLRALEEAAS